MLEAMFKFNSIEDVKEFVRLANAHEGSITLYSGKYVIDGKSVMGIFSLDLTKPIKAEIEGSLTQELRDGLDRLIYRG